MARQPIDSALRHEIESIFEEALELRDADRVAFVAARCGSDHRLRSEVDALISAHERDSGILEGNVAAAATRALPDPNRDRRIGVYRVLRELGRGGMGVVYLAERDDGQYRQRVAVKLLRASPDADELHRRFLAERQILASLQHPGIAQLLDGGVADGQLPFLVMEYVDGAPITMHCDRHKLGIDARLRLFRDVCAAVHYAHRNLIIHRDIKPGNILVSDEGGVKLLDFGVAKLLNPSLGPVDQPVTRTEFRAMTPEYASPEQVRGETLTTTSDVYSLGVVLYELLCGRRPYYLARGSLQELTHVVCVQQPDRPSVMATRSVPGAASGAASSDEVAQARGVSSERLCHILTGDLDAIALMALRKEPTERYGSTDLLWQDLQRYLDGLPVLAHRGSRVYRARKFFRRHRVESIAASAVITSLAVGAAVAVRQATVAARERDRAELARAEAEQSLRQSESVTGFLVGLYDATTSMPGGAAITADELVRRGELQLESLRGRPLEQARMLEAMGRIHTTMAKYQEARSELERSHALRVARLGPNHAEVAGTLYHLSETLRRMGQYHQADSLAERSLAIRTATFGARHPATAEVLVQRAMLAVYFGNLNQAEELSRLALDIRRESLEPTDPLIGAGLRVHASHLTRLGRNGEAEAELREAIALYQALGGTQSHEAAYLQLRLADLVVATRGDTSQAESLMRSALAITRASLGEDRPRTGWAMGDLSDLLSRQGKHEEAIGLARGGVDILRQAFGPRHPNVAELEMTLSNVYRRAGRLADAERTVRESLEIFEQAVGRNHQTYASALGVRADVLMDLRRYDEAISVRRRIVEIGQRRSGEGYTLSGLDVSKLAQVHARKGEYTVADSLFQVALGALARYRPGTHREFRDVYERMAERYRLDGKPGEAERYERIAQPR